jgi:hypothetical protein
VKAIIPWQISVEKPNCDINVYFGCSVSWKQGKNRFGNSQRIATIVQRPKAHASLKKVHSDPLPRFNSFVGSSHLIGLPIQPLQIGERKEAEMFVFI